jgi:hypothetical protein
MKKIINGVIGWCVWILLGFLVTSVIVITVVNLPSLAEWYRLLVHDKANPLQMNMSRSELLKILISLISPVLSFFVLKNTVKIQRESIIRRNIDDVNRDFYGLIGIFSKQQQEHKDMILEFNDNAIISIGSFNIGYSQPGINPNQNNQYSYYKWGKKEEKWFERCIQANAPEMIDADERVNFIINRQFDSVYHELSSYFKVLHRILKNLNEKLETRVITKKIYFNYIGILRAQISSEELVIILVNSLYAQRGLGLGIELVGSDFFGNERDFELEQHFEFPEPQISSNDMSEFVLLKDNKMKNRRIELRKALNQETGTQSLESKTNFINFSKDNPTENIWQKATALLVKVKDSLK